jgi:hypothetical protein
MNAPDFIKQGNDAFRVTYARKDDLCALHGVDPSQVAAVVATIGDDIAVVSCGETAADSRNGPVYVDTRSGALAIPTGRVFVRFTTGTDPATQRDTIERAGFRIVEVPPYSPASAWVEPLSGDIADGVARRDLLLAIRGVEGAELELLRSSRTT